MKSKSLVLTLLTLMMIICVQVAAAQQVQPSDPEWLTRMYQAGWKKVQKGVLQRDTGRGKFETFSYGAEGRRWIAQSYKKRLSRLERELEAYPSDDLATAIAALRESIASLEAGLKSAPSADSFDGAMLSTCFSYDQPTAYAGPQESPRGVMATARANWYSDETCAYVGFTDAYAYAQALDENGTLDSQTRFSNLTGTSIQSSVSASASGMNECRSEAQATLRVDDLDFFYQTPLAVNYSCVPSVNAAITGPAQATIDYYGTCADVTWTASATGGTPGYTYSWYIDTILQGTGPTLTRTYCEGGTNVTVKVIALDSRGWTDEATFTTQLLKIDPVVASVSGPARVTTDHYSAACANATWTASATGGHAGGYTYAWYLGSDPTVQGTGSTFTKSYCGTNQAVTVKVVAQDSDGHSDDATFTTDVQHIGPVVATVSGPATVTTDFYSSACADVTWTASVTGGHPNYAFKWYIGTDPTVQGTGSSFTKRYCNTSQSVAVKVVALDSDGHTDDAILTTNIQYKPPVVASISGQSTVTTDSYTSACADVTWTASTTGGHAGYTYSWYIGTGTTVQGTGSTFTKRYCSTSQSVTVKVVARDTDGHTDDETFTTSISYRAPIVATISGPSSAATNSSTTCVDVTWTASATGSGHSGFTYKWYIGTTLQGSAASLTKRYCSTSQSVTVKVVARASDSHESEATHTTTITHTNPPPTASISGPASVTLATSGECKSITWTASVTGGTPGYTYSWYIGTSTTVQGTASTLTKTYCGAQTINVKLVIRDSAALTNEATFTTRLSLPLAVSISGPDDIYLRDGQCSNAIWMANASGGTPGYTYSWYISVNDSIFERSGTPVSMTYCNPQWASARVVVRDSTGQTAEATALLTVRREF